MRTTLRTIAGLTLAAGLSALGACSDIPTATDRAPANLRADSIPCTTCDSGWVGPQGGRCCA
jgi:hypothetical protein